MEPPIEIYKGSPFGTSFVATSPFSLFYARGIPGPAAAPSPGMAGEALTSYPGQLPFTNPVSGNTYIAKFSVESTVTGITYLLDRVWHNSGINTGITTAQTVNSVAFPPRDINGTSNGEGFFIGLELSAAATAGTPGFTILYTDSLGVSNRTASGFISTTATAVPGSFYPMILGQGNTGVRSIQSITLSTTWTSAVAHLVVYRVLAVASNNTTRTYGEGDPISSGFTRLYDNTVPFLITMPASTVTSFGLYGDLVLTQG